MNWLNFLMEDILRLAKEKNNPTVEDIIKDSKVGREDIKKAIEELEKKNLINFTNEKINLTKKGEKLANIIYEHHKMIEDAFDHRTAHSLEHFTKKYVDEAKAIGKKAIPIDKFMEGENGLIALFEIEDPRILSRLIGVGITIGAGFSIVKLRRDGIILEIDGRLVIIDRGLGKYILGVKKDENSLARPA